MQKIINVVRDHLNAHIDKHALNVEIMLENPMAIPEHTDLVEAIELELGKMAEYMDKLEALERLV